jgi:glycosyltransferase involved in cell wall biosynthesis
VRILLTLYEHDRDVRGGMGGFRHAIELAEAWGRAGHEVLILRPGLGHEDEATTATIVETPLIDRPVVRPLSAYAGLLARGLATARRFRPEVIYAREMLGPAPLLLARVRRCPLVIEVNGDSYAHRRDALAQSRAPLALIAALQRTSFRAADRVVTVTPGLRAMVIARFGVAPDRVRVVGNGTNLARLMPLDPGACRGKLGLAPDAPCVGFVGTFFHHQGVATLIAAAPAILAAFPSARFLIVGDGPARGAWHDAVRAAGLQDAFVFPGQVTHADVGTWINAMDVCVAPFTGSRGETSPLKLFDYLACGRPVVVSAIPAVADESRASGGCVEVPPDDPAALASAVRQLLSDPGRRQRLGDAGRAWIVRERSWDTVARRVLDVCAEARAQGSRR